MAQVIEMLTWLGYRSYHTYDSRRSVAGFPDILAFRGTRKLALELKTDKPDSKPSPEQLEWLDTLQAAGFEASIERPAGWDALVERVR